MNPNDPSNPYDPNQNAAQPGAAFAPNGASAPVQQPYAAQQPTAPYNQPAMPQQSTGGGAVTSQMSASAGTPRKGRKGLIVGIVVLLVAAAVGGYFIFGTSTKSNSGGSNGGATAAQLSSQLQLLQQKGAHLQAGDVGAFDKTTLFYAVLKNAAQQRVVTSTTDRYQGTDATDQTTRALEFVHRAAFDYKTKALAQETQSPKDDFVERCVNGKNYTYDDINTMAWQPETGASADCNDPNSYMANISDGINAGGMSAAQAQAFVSNLAKTPGLISVSSIAYATHNNAPYIRLGVTINPIKTSDGLYEGMGFVLSAFENAGLDPATWPYDSFDSLATGATFIYYVNPATQLPAYSQIAPTYSLDPSGQKKPSTYIFQDTEYAFGGSVQQLPLTGAPQPIKLGWPEEKF